MQTTNKTNLKGAKNSNTKSTSGNEKANQSSDHQKQIAKLKNKVAKLYDYLAESEQQKNIAYDFLIKKGLFNEFNEFSKTKIS